MNRLKAYAYLMRLNKPIGIFLLLWPTVMAFILAGNPTWPVCAVFIIGVVLMRSAGCIMNDIADRHFDGKVQRTKDRPLVSGKVSVREALCLAGILAFMAFLLVLTLNRFTIVLAVIGALLAVGYPFLKRITHLPQFGLGIAFAWGIPMAFAAELNQIPTKAWVLFLAGALWPVVYDTYYAMVDREEDQKIGIKSTAILWGEHDKLIIGLLQVLLLLLWVWVGVLFSLNFYYFISVAMVSILFIYQQWITRHRDRGACFKAFLNHHWVGAILVAGLLI